MGTQIGVEAHGHVDQEDRDRAEMAALAVLDDAGAEPSAAYAEFMRQWLWLETEEAEAQGLCQDYRHMTGLAALWVRAQNAADRALTEGWAVPGRVLCTISA